MAEIKTLYKSNPRDILSCFKSIVEQLESGEVKPINAIVIIEEEERIFASKMGLIGGDNEGHAEFNYLLDFIKAAHFDDLFHSEDEDYDDCI